MAAAETGGGAWSAATATADNKRVAAILKINLRIKSDSLGCATANKQLFRGKLSAVRLTAGSRLGVPGRALSHPESSAFTWICVLSVPSARRVHFLLKLTS